MIKSILKKEESEETNGSVKDEIQLELHEQSSKRPVRKTRGQINKIASFYSSDEFEDGLIKINHKGGYSGKKSRRKFKDDKTSKLYSCEFCPAIFANNTQLRFHAKIHLGSPSKIHECNECSVVFSCLSKLMKHKQKVHLQDLHCKLCNSKFNHINSLRLHMRLHSGEKPYSCNECGVKFVQSSHLSIHKRSHTGEKPYQCTVCKAAFKQISHLRSHERIHTQDKRYSCTSCGVSFIQKSSLNRHIRIHTGERPYACNICHAAFCVKNNLTRHMIIHTGLQPYRCDLCGASFSQAIDLKRHKISHTGIKPYKCDECDSSFSRKNNLKWHKFTHTGETPFECELCPASFMKPRDLKKHKLSNHNIEAKNSTHIKHQCSICNKTFDSLDLFKLHEMEHRGIIPLSCDKCSESFPDQNTLNKHKSQMHKEQLTCNVCGEKFTALRNLKRHARQHVEKSAQKPSSKDCPDKSIIITPPVSTSHAPADSSFATSVEHINPQHQIRSQNLPQLQQQIGYVQMHADLQSTNIQQATTCVINASETVTQSTDKVLVSGSLGLANVPSVVSNAVPAIVVPSAIGQPICSGKPAGDCPNHSSHLLILNGNNQYQSWCFCDAGNVQTAIAAGIPSTEYVQSTSMRPIESVQTVHVQQQKPHHDIPVQTLQPNFVSFIPQENVQEINLSSQDSQTTEVPSAVLQMYNTQGSSSKSVQPLFFTTTNALTQFSLDAKNVSLSVHPTGCDGQILSNTTLCWSNTA